MSYIEAAWGLARVFSEPILMGWANIFLLTTWRWYHELRTFNQDEARQKEASQIKNRNFPEKGGRLSFDIRKA
jgi:hypothetical protein